MTEDQWRWAEAATIKRIHGPGAAVYVAERITALADADDLAGVARFRGIEARLVQLRGGAAQ